MSPSARELLPRVRSESTDYSVGPPVKGRQTPRITRDIGCHWSAPLSAPPIVVASVANARGRSNGELVAELLTAAASFWTVPALGVHAAPHVSCRLASSASGPSATG